jgi:hypothetical protein
MQAPTYAVRRPPSLLSLIILVIDTSKRPKAAQRELLFDAPPDILYAAQVRENCLPVVLIFH